MKNGVIWQDVNGNDIHAHAGCIMQFGDTFYWYGEDRSGDNLPPKEGRLNRVDMKGITCYTSKDLVNWTYEGHALSPVPDDPESPLHTSKVAERPKVIYNEKTGKYVMWLHLDYADYVFGGIGIAIADDPKGPFTLLQAKQPNRQDSRDMTLFQDLDGTAYLVHSTNWNKDMDIARLNDTYTDLDGFYVTVMRDQEREAPALCYHDGMYYMVTSGCTGWAPNSALFSRCPNLLGQWKLIDNPCEGPNYRITYYAQDSFIFQVDGRYFIMFDHWHEDDIKSSGYSILPITFHPDQTMTITWQDEWNGLEG